MWLFDSNDEIDVKVNRAIHNAKRAIVRSNLEDLKKATIINASGQQAIKADIVAETAFLESLIQQRLSGVLYSEESGVKPFGNPKVGDKESVVLLLDPLDGSQNFIKGLPIGCISVAYGAYEPNPSFENLTKASIMGIYTDELFFAEKGKGSYFNGDELIRVSNKEFKNKTQESLQISYYGYGKNSLHRMLDHPNRYHLRSFGSAAWELVLIAVDRNDAYIDVRGVLKAHDFAAAKIILEEIGAYFEFLTLNGYGDPQNIPLDDFKSGYSIVASKHKKLIDQLKEDFLSPIL